MSRPTPSRSRRALKRAPLRPMALEPRLMFDGAAVDTAVQAAADAAAAAAASTRSTGDAGMTESHPGDTASSVPPATEIVFITTSTPEWQKLASNVRAGVDVVLLDPEQDGLTQIDAALAGRTGITALHIVSHGADGLIVLGNTPLDTDGLVGRASEVAAWRSHLSANADILLYGCDVAADTQGRAFANLLAEVTGADVAASSDTTGAAAHGGDWNLEYASGAIETTGFLTAAGVEAYDARLATISLSGASGWTAIMFGSMRDPDGDSQAGAADTDIIGDSAHGSLYTAYSDNGTAGTADDYLYFRMRIDNPTSDTDFSGVAIVGMDANGDGRVDLFMSVDGRNNTRAVRLLDPGTGANLSPNTTTTAPLPTGWLTNNGVYAFNPSNYSVDAVSSLNDPHYGPSTVNPSTGTATDLTGDGKRDVFISWRVPLADITAVLAKPSPVDRNGVYGPRGASGLPGFDQNTPVRYVSFTQTQPGPINGDLNGVGSSYDKNATFAALGAFTTEMSASNPVAASTRLDISDNVAGIASGPVTFTFQFSEGITGFDAGDITVSGGTKGSFTAVDADTYTLIVNPTPGTASGTIQVDVATDAARSIAGNLPTAAGTATQAFDTLAPQITIATPASALSGTPTLQGTTDLPDGSLITITIDPDNNPATANDVIYKVMAAGGLWTLNTATAAPLSGSLPAGGLVSYSKVTASGTDAAGNTASAVELNPPTVTAQTTSNSTPTVSGTWTNIPGDTLTVTVNGTAYTPTISGNTWTVHVTDALAASPTPYEVVATVSRGSAVSDTTTGELTISSAPPAISVDITGGATASGSDTTPVISGSSTNAGGYVVVRLDPGNDGNLTDAVTYSVTPDGSGNWTLDTGSATPISGTIPTGGFIGAVGIRAIDSTASASDTQVLTVTSPSVSITAVTSTATTNSNAQVNNGDAYINMTEDDAVTITGSATVGFTVHIVIADANGNSVEYSNLAVDGSGIWTVSATDIGTLDSTTLTMTASLTGTGINATNTSYTHDAIAPRIFITNPSEIKKNGGVLYGGSELANTSLTITIRNDTDTATMYTGTATTNANGDWTVTTSGNLVSGSSGNVIIRVAPTTTPAMDAAKNIVGTAQITQYVAANAVTSSISIGTIATANTITVGDIGSGLAITGTTTLSGSGTVTLAIDDGDVGTAANFTATGSYSGGTWTVNLTKAQVQSLLNGQLTVTASAQDTSASPAITISDVALPTLSLLTPTLTISDDTPGSAGGPVTFTFQFSEGVSNFDAGDITVSNGTKGTFTTIDADTYTLVVTPTPNSSGDILVQVGNNIATGVNTGRGNGDANITQPFNTTVAAAAPSLTINADALASDSTPVITGTSSLPPGAPIVVTIDPDNDAATANSITYAATVDGSGNWSVDTGSATPTGGSLPAGGLSSWAKVSATATNAYGNSTSVTALDIPVVTPALSSSAAAVVHGTWTNLPGDTLSVLINGTTYSVANGNLSISGNTWSLTTAALTDGTYNVTATVSRSGPDSRSDLSSGELVIDTLGTVDITGGATVLTNDATPLITGTTTGMPAGTLLTIGIDTDNNGSYDLSYQTSVGADGSWSLDTGSSAPSSGTLPANGLNGSTPIRATATDPAGNTGGDTQILDVDRIPPQVTLTSGSRSPSSQPVITGTTDLPAGSTVTLVIDPDNLPGGTTYTYTAIVQPDGTWRVDTGNPSATGGSGPNQSYPSGSTLGLTATATDAAGNSAAAKRALEIDSTSPTVAIQTPLDANGTPDGSLDATEDDNVVIRGTTTGLVDGKTVTVTITDGTTTISDTATVTGNSWTLAPLDLSFLAEGRITVTATHTDEGGNTYSDAASISHVKNSTISIERISEDTGIVADFITRDDTISIYGTATPGATVTLLVKDGSNATVATFSVVADVSTGAWSTAATASLGAGTYTIDAAVGAQHATRSMTIVDTSPPLLTSSSPADNATGVSVGADLTLSFDRNILPGSGTVSLYRSSDGSLVESYNVSTGLGSITDGNGTALGSIRFTGNSLTLNPGTDLDANTRYYIRVDGGAVIDQAGNPYVGITDDTTLDFRTVGGANQAPTVTTSGGSAAFTEGADTASTPVVVDPGLTLADTDSPTLASATVAITGHFQSSQDVLAFTNDGSTMGNITASYDSATGVLSLSSAGATATLAQWQAALRSVTYTNSSDTPDTATRTVSFTVNDGTDSSTAATRDITLADSNDSPAITAPASISITEDAPSALTGISFADPDAGSASLTVTLSVASGSLTATSAGGVTVGGTSSALTLTGAQADLNAFIAGGALSFQNAANVTTTVSLGISVDDAGNSGSGGAKTDSTTLDLQIGTLNDPPTVTTSGGSATFTEGADTASTPVVVDPGLTLADTDSPTLASASVAITGHFQSGQDVLAFTNDGSTMGNITASYDSATGVLSLSSAGATATLAQWQAALRSVTYTNSSDTPDTATRTVSFTVNDGTDSSTAATRDVTLADSNDSPAITAPASISITEDAPSALTGISFADPDAGSASLTVTLSVASGSLTATSAGGVTVGGTSSALTLTGAQADLNAFIAGGALSFQNPANVTTTVSLGISVDDAGNSGSGGAKTDSTTLDLQIGTLNDPPTVTTSGGSATFTEGADTASTPVVVDPGLTLADTDSPTLASASVAITGHFQSGQDVLAFTNDGSTMGNITASYDSATGVLSLSSAGATATLAQWQAALRSVTYTNSSDTPDTATRTVSFTVNDGTDSSTAATRDVTLADSNDSPAITAPASISITEDAPSALTGISFADPDAGSASLTVTLSVASGSLTATSGAGVTVGGTSSALTLTGAQTDLNAFIAGGALSFQNAANVTTTVSLGISVDDAGNSGSGGAKTDSISVDLEIGALNDAPSVTTSGGSAAFTEGADTASTPVVVDPGLTLADTDSPTLASASVAITGHFQSGQDVLAFTNDGSTIGNITASYDSATGVLSLSSAGATATLAQWQAALRSVTYTNSSDTPDTATRTVSFTVNDGTDSSTAATRDITLADSNDSPAITAPASISITEDAPSALTGISFNDPDAGSASLTVTLSVASGSLTATSGAGVTVGGTSSALTLTGAQADLNAFIAGGALSFQNAANVTTTVSLGISVDDAGNSGSGGAKTDSTTVALQIGTLNDPPDVTTSGGSATFTGGGSPVVVDAGLTVTDIDSPTLASASVAITGNFQSGQDVLAFTNDGSTMGNVSASYNSATGVLTLSSAGATATLAQWQAALRSVTYANTAASPAGASRTISFTVNDGVDDSATGSRPLSINPPPGANPEITGPTGGQGAPTGAVSIPENSTPVASFSASEAVTWSLAGADAGHFQIDANGQLSFITAPDFEAPTDQGDGTGNNTYVVQIRATDADSNVAVQTLTVTVTNVVEATAPTQTVTIERMALDTGDSDSDFVTANGNAGRSVEGSLDAALGRNEVVELSFDGGRTWVQATVSGTRWSATDPDPHAGSWTILARVGNPAAGLSGPVTSRAVTLDTTPPAVPTVDALDTTSSTPTISGSAQVGPGERFSVTVGGATYTVGDGHLSLNDGRWTLVLPADAPLGTGTHSVLARITDPAGNVSDDASSSEITLRDVPPPRPSLPVTEVPVIPVEAPTPPPPASIPQTVVATPAPVGLATPDPVRIHPTGDQQLAELRRITDEVGRGDFGIRTRSEGFPIVVLRTDGNGSEASNAATLVINRGIPDVLIRSNETGGRFEVPIPNDAFAHTRQDAVISLNVTRSDGRPLPSWLQFDPRMGIFRGSPPPDFNGEVEIRVVARDESGNQVEVTFRIRVGNKGAVIRSGALDASGAERAARPTFSSQLRMAGGGGQTAERDRLIAHTRALAARKATTPG